MASVKPFESYCVADSNNELLFVTNTYTGRVVKIRRTQEEIETLGPRIFRKVVVEIEEQTRMYNKIMEDYSQNVLEKDNGTVIDIMIHEQRNIFQQLELQYEITKRKMHKMDSRTREYINYNKKVLNELARKITEIWYMEVELEEIALKMPKWKKKLYKILGVERYQKELIEKTRERVKYEIQEGLLGLKLFVNNSIIKEEYYTKKEWGLREMIEHSDVGKFRKYLERNTYSVRMITDILQLIAESKYLVMRPVNILKVLNNIVMRHKAKLDLVDEIKDLKEYIIYGEEGWMREYFERIIEYMSEGREETELVLEEVNRIALSEVEPNWRKMFKTKKIKDLVELSNKKILAPKMKGKVLRKSSFI